MTLMSGRDATLTPRDARLRMRALKSIARAAARLSVPTFTLDAFKATLYDRPRVALQRIKAAKAHVAKAEEALKKWAGR